MKPSKEMRERAAAISLKFVEEQSLGEWGEDLVVKDAAKLTDVLFAFTAAEVSHAVQECIEEACTMTCCDRDCADLSKAERINKNVRHREHGEGEWVHTFAGFGDMQDEFRCSVSALRELLYQKQLASEGEEKS